MKKTNQMVYISYANGQYGIERRVWKDDNDREMVKIEGTWRELWWYIDSNDFLVQLWYT